MDELTLPPRGPVYLDTSGFIYSVERIEPYDELLAPMWRAAREQRFTIVSSELVVLEALVRPFQEGDAVIESLFRNLFEASDVVLIPALREHWEEAARVRAATRLRTPDALHAATATLAECTLFVTNDGDFRRVEGLPVVVLDDLVTGERRT